MDTQFASGREFILREGRLLERRLFATCFEGAPATGVVDVLRGYRNDDGGFGHGLEPDKRCPASLPIDVEAALQALGRPARLTSAWSWAPATTWPRSPPRLNPAAPFRRPSCHRGLSACRALDRLDLRARL